MFFIAFLLLSTQTYGQDTYQFGIMPSLNLNKSLKKSWKINMKIEDRQSMKQGVFNENSENELEHLLTDVAILASKKVGPSQKLAGGYQIRIMDGESAHRSIQQFISVRDLGGIRLAYRIGTDQTFLEDQPTVHRIRLRFGSEFALNGQNADPKELYIKVNNEYLNIFQKEQHDLEVRVVPLLGYLFTPKNRLEVGMDYRIDQFMDGTSDQNFWLRINWFYSL